MPRHKILLQSTILACLLSTGSLAGEMAGIAPATLEAIGDTGVKRITLTEKAAWRIGITVEKVREESRYQTRRYRGDVTALNPVGDLGKVAGIITVKGQLQADAECLRSVRAVPLTGYDWSRSILASKADGALMISADNAEEAVTNYAFEENADTISLGSQMLVEICTAGSEKERSVVPHGSLLFAADGTTWVYFAESALTFVRFPVEVDWIDGDQAILKSGPPAGSPVVVTGSVELFGEEFGIGH